MARWSPVPVAGGAYSDDAKSWSVQDCLNYIPANAEKEGTRSAAMLRGLPGNKMFSDLGTNAPIRGLHNSEGQLLAVSASKLVRVGTNGVPTYIGAIPGVARVSMAHNQITNGNEVAIATGTAGYIYNTTTGTVTQIADEGFPGAKVFDFLDGYLMYVEPQGRFWGWSDLAAGTSYNTLDRAEAEAQPDKIVTGIVTHREWLVFGERSAEFYRNTGAATGTFQRIDGTEMEVGCASTHGAAKLDNAVCFLGHDGIVYRVEGYQPRRISTHAIEQAISRSDLSLAFATVYEDRGHKVFYLTFPDGFTFGYDVSTGEWHRRASYGMDRWRMNALVRWRNMWIGGDFSNGKLYAIDWNYQQEDGAEMERRRVFAVLHDQENAITVNAARIVFDVAQASPATIYPDKPTITGDAPDTAAAVVYSFAYTITGSAPLTASIYSGALPPGLSLSAAGVITGSPTTVGTYSFSVRVTDAYGQPAEVSDTIAVSAATVACGIPQTYAGSTVFPLDVVVTLGTGTGTVTLTYDADSVPDKFQVIYDGVTVIDTGYRGSTAFQTSLTAALAARGLPDETVAGGGAGTASFAKSTATMTAIVRVWAPLPDTSWAFTLGCPV